MWETGTLNHEGMAGTTAAIDFIADLGERHLELVGDRLPAGLQGRRRAVVAGMLAGEAYEQPLASGCASSSPASPASRSTGRRRAARAPPPSRSPSTASRPGRPAGRSATRGLFAWDGDFYAARLVELLGLQDRGGLVRVGLAPYTTEGELERLVAAVGDLSRSMR